MAKDERTPSGCFDSEAENGLMTCDGNYAAAHVAYMLSTEPTAHHSEVATIYSIMPLNPMAGCMS